MTILFADDHQLILDGLVNLIKSNYNAVTIHTAHDKTTLFELLKQHQIDILIQDIKFGKDSAKTFLADIKQQYPTLKILVLSTLSDTISIQQLKSKSHGYVLK